MPMTYFFAYLKFCNCKTVEKMSKTNISEFLCIKKKMSGMFIKRSRAAPVLNSTLIPNQMKIKSLIPN